MGDIDKSFPHEVSQDVIRLSESVFRVGLFHLGIRVAERNPQIEPSVIVEIKKFGSPAAILVPGLRQALGERYVLEQMGSLILV